MIKREIISINDLPDGLYDRLIDQTILDAVQHLVSAGFAQTESPSGIERRRRLTAALAQYFTDLLDDLSVDNDVESEQAELDLINSLLDAIHRARPEANPLSWILPLRILRTIHRQGPPPQSPITGLNEPWLFTAGRGDPALMAELRNELSSANQVDILVSFITWSGIRKLWDVLEKITAIDANRQVKTRLRILTTTYKVLPRRVL